MVMRPASDRVSFRALLTRTLVLPLALLSLLSALFVAEILYLERLHRQVDRADEAISLLNETQKLFVDSETGLRGYLLTSRREFLEPYNQSQSVLAPTLVKLREAMSGDVSELHHIDRIEEQWGQWTRSARRRIAEGDQMQRVSVEESLQGKEIMDSIRALIHEFIVDQQALRAQTGREVDGSTALALWSMAFLAVALGGFLAVAGRRQLLNLSETYEKTLSDQLRQTEELQRREWISRGRAQLADVVRSDLGEQPLAERVLAALARYTGADVGVLYVVSEPKQLLERRAAYACAASPDGPLETLPLDASWVGQVARDGQLARLSELPADHVKVATATGTFSPRELVVAPLTGVGRTVAVVELGFLRPPGPEALEYLAESAQIGGGALLSAVYRAHLQELLAATQRQAEDLQHQQEELRVANEELQEQSRVLQQSQTQLEAQQEELKVTNAQLGDQSARLESQRDDLERTQTDLVAKAEQLARANQYKSEFLANMSHELRTPLNSTLILAKLLADNKDGNLTPEQVRFADTISSAGKDLLQLINDILDLSRVEAGKLDIKPEEVPLAGLVEALERTFEPLARQKQLTLTTGVDPGVPARLETDPQRLQQVLKNLLSNAVKFTDHGEVSLRVVSSGPDRIAFVVRDTGIGIARGDLGLIFEAFQQVDGSQRRQHGGTGLGLTISRDLARRLGGEIFVESAPGKGSTFSLVLPVRFVALAARSSETGRSDRHPTPEPAAEPARRPVSVAVPRQAQAVADDREDLVPGARTLLVVEDDPRFARILSDLAHEQQFRCLIAGTGGEGYELARRHRPSAIVLDVNLPDESGLAVLEQLKRDGETRHIPVHVVSVADYTQRALELGAAGYALKPVSREELSDAIRKLDEMSGQRTRQVLVVEDVEGMRENLRELLESEGVEITPVGTAGAALEQLGKKTFDCMVLDLGLPDMSGYELLERMSTGVVASFPPVIVYTARALSPEEEVQLRRHSTSVVIKGARSPERLLDEVTLFIHRLESTLPREQQRLLREVRSREAVLEGRRVLLVEDDVRNIFALTSVLEPKGAQLVIARNGREALAELTRAQEGGKPVDLVLMDVMMPVMDGLTAIREIRRNSAWAKLPVIALTAKAMPDDREKCLAAGANDYIAKPLDIDKLLSLVRVWMPK
jgi:signal transduction histidine kinase/DNA-binding response OmpR family regulator/CHASE3 domain sensor protein